MDTVNIHRIALIHAILDSGNISKTILNNATANVNFSRVILKNKHLQRRQVN